MSKKEIDVSTMVLENGVYVDYSERYRATLSASVKETKIGYKCYDTIEHNFVGIVDECKVACWYVNEKSCVKITEVEVDYTKWYVGNIYAPRNKTKIGKEIVKGFPLIESTGKESVRLMTPSGEIKEVLNPVSMDPEAAASICDVVDATAMYVSSYNVAMNGEEAYPVVGYKLFGKRTGRYMGIVDLNGEYRNIQENELKQFNGPSEMAVGYV